MNPARGKITSLGIGGNKVSAKAAKNNPRYPWVETREVKMLIISTYFKYGYFINFINFWDSEMLDIQD